MVIRYFEEGRISTPLVDFVPYLLTEGRIGYEVIRKDGTGRSYVYLNPSGDYDDSPDVFVYTGPTPDIDEGQAQVFVDIPVPPEGR